MLGPRGRSLLDTRLRGYDSIAWGGPITQPETPQPHGLPAFPAAGFSFSNRILTKIIVWLGAE